jgi:hypothetical protein
MCPSAASRAWPPHPADTLVGPTTVTNEHIVTVVKHKMSAMPHAPKQSQLFGDIGLED